jgi:hypothetical protein
VAWKVPTAPFVPSVALEQWYVSVVRPHPCLLEHEAVAPVTVAAAGAASAEDVDVAAGAFATVAAVVVGSELRAVVGAASLAAVLAADVETAVVGAAWVASVAVAVEAPGAALAEDVGGTVGVAAVGRASVVCRSMVVWALPKLRKSSVIVPPDVVSTVTSASAPASMVVTKGQLLLVWVVQLTVLVDWNLPAVPFVQ